MEQLQLVLQAMQTMGEAGKEAFLWWLLAAKVLPSVCMTAAVLYLFRLIRWGVSMEYNKGFGQEIRDMLSIGSSGYVSDREKVQVRERVRNLLAMERKMKGEK